MEQKKQNLERDTQLPSECTTIIVGPEMMADGSRIVARSEDWNAMLAKNLELYPDTASSLWIAPSAASSPERPWATPPSPPITCVATGAVRASIPPGSG